MMRSKWPAKPRPLFARWNLFYLLIEKMRVERCSRCTKHGFVKYQLHVRNCH